MKKFLAILFLLFVSISFAKINCPGTQSANPSPPPAPVRPIGSLCDMGNNPAATLLIPYFEVDSQDNLGLDTLIGIINLSGDYIVAHVVVWNVDSWVVFDFNIVLTGYDVATFSMRDILVYGKLPNNCCTSPSHSFRTRYVDCNGDGQYFSQPWTNNDGLFSFSGYAMDIACYSTLSDTLLDSYQCRLSIGSYDGWNVNYVGYITIDTNLTCTGGMPDYNPTGYFAPTYIDTNGDGNPDHGVMENTNVLLGDIIYYDYRNLISDGMPAVHIEAFGESNDLPGHRWGMQGIDFIVSSVRTFYDKWELDWGGFAQSYSLREPLPVYWAFRYFLQEDSSIRRETWVDVWRSHNSWHDHWYVGDGNCPWPGFGYIDTVLCGDLRFSGGRIYCDLIGLIRPSIICYDEQEQTTQGDVGPSPPPEAPGFDQLWLETQRARVGIAEGWPLVDVAGWCGLSFVTDPLDTDPVIPGLSDSFDQAWLNVRYTQFDKAANRYSWTAGFHGFSYLNGCALVWNDPDGIPGSGDEYFGVTNTH